MKLIIQIPCFNEADQLPRTLADLPRVLEGFEVVEWLVVDDGSTDDTVEIARAHGVDHFVRLTNNKGLATGFQAGIDTAPVRTNATTRESRLFPSMGAYVRRNALSIFRIYAQYEPLRVFWSLSVLIGLGAIGVWVRFTVAYIAGNGKGHVQSLILGAVLFIAAVVLWALGVIGDLLAAQRVMTQKTFERVRRIELELGVAPSHYEPRAAGELRPVKGAERGRREAG